MFKTIYIVILFLSLQIHTLPAMELILPDAIKYYTTAHIDPHLKIFPLQNGYHGYFTSETLPIHPVKSLSMNNFSEDDIEPLEEKENYPNPQFWGEHPYIRISDDINYTNDTYPIIPPGPYISQQSYSLKCDGINKKGISVVCTRNPSYNNTSLYVFKRVSKRGKHTYNEWNCPVFIHIGDMTSLTLESNHNRIIYSISQTPEQTLYIAELTETKNTFTLTPICQSNTLPPFKKIISLGNTHDGTKNNLSRVYLGLTTDGKLYTFWFDKNGKIHYAMQKSGLTFLDIAVDETYKCESGLLPKIALIDTEGKLFITDLTQKGNPTLYKIHQAEPQDIENIRRITYYNGICGIIYYDKENIGIKYEEIYDNFSLISAAHLFKNAQLILLNPNYNQTTGNVREIIDQKNNYRDLRIENTQATKDKKDIRSLSFYQKNKIPLLFFSSGIIVSGIIACIFYKYFYHE